MSSIKEAKLKLQDELLDLIRCFEEEFDVNVTQILLQEYYRTGRRLAYTAGVVVRVEG